VTPGRKDDIRSLYEAREQLYDNPDAEKHWAELVGELLAALDSVEEELRAYKPCSRHGVSDLPDTCWLCLVTEDLKYSSRARDVVEAARFALRALDSEEPKKYSRGFGAGKIEYAGDVLEEALKRYDENTS